MDELFWTALVYETSKTCLSGHLFLGDKNEVLIVYENYVFGSSITPYYTWYTWC